MCQSMKFRSLLFFLYDPRIYVFSDVIKGKNYDVHGTWVPLTYIVWPYNK